MPYYRIHHRISVPIVLMALVATVAAALVSVSVISNALESRVESQITAASALVSQSHFALNPSILQLVKEVVNADIVTASTGGAILASTMDESARPGLTRIILASQGLNEAATLTDGSFVVKRVSHAGTPYTVAYRRVAQRPGTVVAFVSDTSELAAATNAARRTILLVSTVSFLMTMLIARVVARRVSAPIEELLEFTRDVTPASGKRAPVAAADETGRLAQAFNDMLDRLHASQEALVRSEKLAVTGLLAARVAHDIRTPLSSIKMQAQLLRSRLKSDSDTQALLTSVLRGIDQVENVVRGLLELARPGELTRRRTRLNDVVDEVVRQMAPQMTHLKIAVTTGLDPDLPDVALDDERFRQALLNVISNAAEAMPEGGTLEIRTVRGEDGSTVVLDVCDDGTGIDPSVARRLFDPFVSTKRDGVGLGLVNAKAVVESHGGEIELSPRPGRGTRARMILPADQT